MSDAQHGVVIVGAGHAAGVAAAQLRQFRYDGPITLVGEEPIHPYQRPPLSKAWLKGEADAESLALRPDSFYDEQSIAVILGTTVTAIQRGAKTVTLSDGRTLPYDTLILATGAQARALAIPGADLDGVMSLRSAADAERLKGALGPGKRLAVIGGGYIGLEVAASARHLGSEVIVLEREPRILARVAGETLSSFFQAYHEAHGVRFELSAMIEAFVGEGGHVTAVRLEGGRVIDCDAALVGVGAPPRDELARAAGLPCDNGVVVDERACTADADIYAIGDVTWRPNPLYNRMFRLESVANALEQAKQAAAAIVGRPAPAHEVTWNWSDQYDLKYQFAGLPLDCDSVIVRGDPATAQFALFHMQGDVIRAVEAVNAPAEFMGGRLLIGQKRPVDRSRLADLSVSMKEVAAA